MSEWQTHGSKIAYKNKWIQIREDAVTDPSGKASIYGVLELDDNIVYIAAVEADGRFYLTQQYRYPLQQNTWELPAGRADNQDLEVAARRELLEETGMSSRELKKIGIIAVDTGISSGMVHLFVARGLNHESNNLDEADGIIETKAFTHTEIRDMIMNGVIICPHTIASFYITSEYLKKL